MKYELDKNDLIAMVMGKDPGEAFDTPIMSKLLKADFAKGDEVTFSYRLMGEIEEIKEDGTFIINRDGQRYIVNKEKITKFLK